MLEKLGLNYKDILPELKSFDLILFSADDAYSNMIKYVELYQINRNLDKDYKSHIYSHVGIVVKSDVLPFLPEDEVYIWESTISGRLAEGIKNIDGKSFLGVQVRNLTDVIRSYDNDEGTRIAVLPLLQEYDKSKIEDFRTFFKEKNNTLYDVNPVSLIAGICPCMRPVRKPIEEVLQTSDLLFCSEMATLVYKILGIFPGNINEKNVVPQDFLGGDIDGEIPVHMFKPHIVITAYPR